MIVRLSPPELGHIRLTFRSEGRELRCLVEVENPRTLGQIEQERPSLIQRLADSGVQLRQMEVGMAQSKPSPSSDSYSPPSDGGAGQQSAGHYGQQGGSGAAAEFASGGEWPRAGTSDGVEEPHGQAAGNGRLNVWI